MIMFPKLSAHLDLFESYCPIANVTTIEPGVLLKVFSRGIVFSLFISLSSIWRGFHVYLEIIIYAFLMWKYVIHNLNCHYKSLQDCHLTIILMA